MSKEDLDWYWGERKAVIELIKREGQHDLPKMLALKAALDQGLLERDPIAHQAVKYTSFIMLSELKKDATLETGDIPVRIAQLSAHEIVLSKYLHDFLAAIKQPWAKSTS